MREAEGLARHLHRHEETRRDVVPEPLHVVRHATFCCSGDPGSHERRDPSAAPSLDLAGDVDEPGVERRRDVALESLLFVEDGRDVGGENALCPSAGVVRRDRRRVVAERGVDEFEIVRDLRSAEEVVDLVDAEVAVTFELGDEADEDGAELGEHERVAVGDVLGDVRERRPDHSIEMGAVERGHEPVDRRMVSGADLDDRIDVVRAVVEQVADDVGQLLLTDRHAGGVRRPDGERAPGLVGPEPVEQVTREPRIALGDPEVPQDRVVEAGDAGDLVLVGEGVERCGGPGAVDVDAHLGPIGTEPGDLNVGSGAVTTARAPYAGRMPDASLVAVLGRGVCAGEPVLHADDLGLTRGDGCFEATRIHVDEHGTRVDQLEAHLARFRRSAAALEIDVDEPAWRALLDEAIAAWTEPGEAILRWMLTRGRERGGPPTGIVTVTPLDERTFRARRGISVVLLDRGHPADAFADRPWLLGGVKTLSYAINVAAGREVARRGADDAIFVSTDGFVLEAPRAAVVWRFGDRLGTTPTDGTGVLASITCEAAIAAAAAAGVEVDVELLPADDLFRADGVWLLSSGRLVAPVTALDGRSVDHDAAWTDRIRSFAAAH